MSETSIEAVGLSKVYWDADRRLEILTKVSLTVKKGEGVAILGPSGSGKTTLLNLLSGLDRPTEGTVALHGVRLDQLGESRKAEFRNRRLGFVFQFYHLFSEFTALENVLLPVWIGNKRNTLKASQGRAEALLTRMGLRGRLSHFPGELSGGEQQRVALARALVNEPDILFCDEPTGNLDREMGEGIAGLLKELFREQHKTVLMVTHDENVARMADRVWDIVKGDWVSL
jgi:ABC-type lipoprotein export system ATPase subunit